MARKKESNITKRLGKVMIYKTLSESSLTKPTNDDAKEVEAELQEFINNRIEVLMGIKPDPSSEREKTLDSKISELYNLLKSIENGFFKTEEKLALSKLAEVMLKGENKAAPVENATPPIVNTPAPITAAPESPEGMTTPVPGKIARPPGVKALPPPTAYQMMDIADQQSRSVHSLNDAIVKGDLFQKQN